MYGLVTSPKDWSVYRDSELLKMTGEVQVEEKGHLEEMTYGFGQMEDGNLWAIQEVMETTSSATRVWGAVLGYMIVYVDDVLMVGTREVTDSASSTIKRKWSTSNPEYAEPGGPPMRFLGIETQRLEDGTYYLHQGSYVREVLERHGGGGVSTFVRVPEEKEEGVPDLTTVKEAQKITGELLWLASKTRPDISWAVMKMSQWAVKRPAWTLELGAAVLAYVRSSMDHGLLYPPEVPRDQDPDLSRRRPRREGTIEVLVDASFSPGDSHSVTGTMILLAGCPIQWESKKQGLMALSTAEAELTALLEGLQAGRSVRALVELLLPNVNLELYNDNRAAVILASGSGGGWRTRHLRIRAACLAEALKVGELSLDHRAGTALWADALTKALPSQALERFCVGVLLKPKGVEDVRKVTQSLPMEDSLRVSKCMMLMLAGASLVPGSSAGEVCEKGEPETMTSGSMFGDLGWLVVLAGLVCLLHMIKELGMDMVKRLISGRENVKVKLLNEQAIAPQKGSNGAAGWDVATTMAVQIDPGERRLLSTGLALELPRGCYGRLASRSSLASQGLEVAGGVIDADFRGEVKVIMVNHGSQPKVFEVGDRIAQIIVEKIAEVPMVVSSRLSSTVRGEGGFGSSGSAARSLRVPSSARRGERVPEEALFARGEPRDEGRLHEPDDLLPEGRTSL